MSLIKRGLISVGFGVAAVVGGVYFGAVHPGPDYTDRIDDISLRATFQWRTSSVFWLNAPTSGMPSPTLPYTVYLIGKDGSSMPFSQHGH